MPHVRQQIREAVAMAVTGLATTGANVVRSRMKPRATGLPCLLVSTGDERVEAIGISGPALLDRQLDVEVKGYAIAADNLDDTLDAIAAEVEAVLGNTQLGGLVKSITLSGIDTDFDESLQQPAGVIALRFSANYLTVADDATTAT